MAGSFAIAPSVQSPRAYDRINLQGLQMAARFAAAASAAMRGSIKAAMQSTDYAFAIHPAEVDEGLVDADLRFGYLPGDVYRYGENAESGVTDMTDAINTCANVCRRALMQMRLGDETCLFSSPLDFSGVHVDGRGMYAGIALQASSAQFDCITSTGNTVLSNFYIHGGWDGATAGLAGDAISFSNGDGYAYNWRVSNVKVQYAKRNQIYAKNCAYGSIRGVKGNASGLHGLVLHGTDEAHQATTIEVGGFSTFSDTPNGFGLDLYYTVSVGVKNVVLENTKGIRLNGTGHRALSLESVYQEGTTGTGFITDNASDGIGLTIKNCFGSGADLPYLPNWYNVTICGNSNMVESAVPLNGRVILADSTELTSSSTGGVSATAVTLDLPPGTWQVFATMQCLNASGLTVSRIALNITNTVTDSGLNNVTGGGFGEGCAEATSFGASGDARINAQRIVQNLTSGNVNTYVRAYWNSSAGTIAYRVFATAVRLQ